MVKWLIIIVIVLGLVVYPTMKYMSVETIEITIKDKERITTGSGEDLSSKYLVYTEGEVFENTDALMFFKWNSSDVQNKLDVGKTYKVKVCGWRMPFFSSYRNIVKIK